MKRIFLAVLTLALIPAAWGADASTVPGSPSERAANRADRRKVNSLKIRLKVEGKELTATLIDSKTSRDFLSLLPLTLTMNDLFGREKFGHLPGFLQRMQKPGKRLGSYRASRKTGELTGFSNRR